MRAQVSTGRAAANRRQFLGAATSALAGASAHGSPATAPTIKAVAFDAFAIFDLRPVFRLVEELFPGRGEELSNQWRTRQFEYTWLRNSMRLYTDFWKVTQDALNYAAQQSKLDLTSEKSSQLMSAYLRMKPWNDVVAALEALRKRGLRLALLANLTPTMMRSCVTASGLQGMFEFELSTDSVKAFKPDPAAYAMVTEAFHLEKYEILFVAFGGWDAAGAKAFGYTTYWVNREARPAEQLGITADGTHRDLVSLPTFLDVLNRGQ
jgi:2-haloacid dehalogenase